ncbi:MAG: cupin domain-containing protein [Gemmatimonadales bacterium]|nr:cupin domain-containing protein [Gemmatimonadales bacterium]
MQREPGRSPGPAVINLADKLALVDAPWSPRVVATLNDYDVKVARVTGEFIWHAHDDTDEMFLVVFGILGIEFRDRTVELRVGEMIVVPRGVEHRPFAREECHLLLIEPRGTVNTGDADSPLRAPNDVWA